MFLYSVLKVRTLGVHRHRVSVCACRTLYSRRWFLHRVGLLYTDQVLADRFPPPRLPCLSLDKFDSRIGSGVSPVVGSNGLEPSTSRLSGVRSNHLSYEPISVAGSPSRPNLLLRLRFSASPWWRRTESNCRPPACKAGALPAELRPHIHRFASLRAIPPNSEASSSIADRAIARTLKIKQCITYLKLTSTSSVRLG